MKKRLDILLVERGLVESRERARALIMAGKVLVDGSPMTKAGSTFKETVTVSLKTADHPYVSRGAIKLAAGLDTFAINPRGLTAMDVGASTGGFTDLLLERGAKHVFAIDVGYGQLHWKIRQDERVTNLERENIRYLDAEKVPSKIDLAVIDVSFISLTKVLEKVSELMKNPGAPILCLVKPQFEVGKDRLAKGGVVRDPEVRLEMVENISTWAKAKGFKVGPFVESPLQGPAGNHEFVLQLNAPDN